MTNTDPFPRFRAHLEASCAASTVDIRTRDVGALTKRFAQPGREDLRQAVKDVDWKK
jgi:hypothetical protein